MPGPATNPVPPDTRSKYASLAELTAIPVGKLYAEGAEMLRQKYLNLKAIPGEGEAKPSTNAHQPTGIGAS